MVGVARAGKTPEPVPQVPISCVMCGIRVVEVKGNVRAIAAIAATTQTTAVLERLKLGAQVV